MKIESININLKSNLGKRLFSDFKITEHFLIENYGSASTDESARIYVYNHEGDKLAESPTWWMSGENIANHLREQHSFTDAEIKEIIKS